MTTVLAPAVGAALLLGPPARTAVFTGGGAGFGIGGTAVLGSGATLGGTVLGSVASSLAVEPDGSIVVAADATGLANNAPSAVELFRLTSAGTRGGFGRSKRPLILHGCHGTGLVAQPDGKLVVACGSYIERLEPNGAPDPRFGDQGRTAVPGAALGALGLAPGGKLVAGGAGVLLRLLPNGAPDPSFGNGGTVLTPARFDTLAVDNKGGIVIPIGGSTPSILRYDATGAPDAAFGSSGSAAVPGSPTAVAVRPDGRIVTAVYGPAYGEVDVVQLLPNGALDPSFAGGGIGVVAPGHSATGPYATATALTLEPDGSIVVAGAGLPSPGNYGYASWFVQRVNPSGSLAESGPSPGFFDLDTDCATEVADAIAAQPDGKVVIVGDACEDTKPLLFVTRYTAALAFDAGPLLTPTRTRLIGKARGATVEVDAQLGPSAAYSVTARVRAPLRLLPGSSIGSSRAAHPTLAISARWPWRRPLGIHLILPRRALVLHHSYAVELTATDAYGKTERSTLRFTAP